MLIPFSLVLSSVKCGKLKKKTCEAFIIIMDDSYSFIRSTEFFLVLTIYQTLSQGLLGPRGYKTDKISAFL